MRVLIAGLGEHKDFGLKSLQSAGHFVGIIDLPQRIPVDLCDWWRAGEWYSVDGLVAAAGSAGFTWDAVLCWDELAVDVVREAAIKLGVPGPRMPAGHFRDKGTMHARLREAGLPTPQLGVVRTLQECEKLARGRFPVVVKPADYGGSGGVRIVAEPEDLGDAFDAAVAVSAGGRVVVDRYVRGPEYSVESVTWAPGDTQVAAVTEKHLTRPPYCAELGHVVPATLSDADREALTAATVAVLDALGMEAGVSHAEFRLTDQGPVLMEVAGRPAGGQIPRLVELATGWNLNVAELAAVTGARTTPAVPAARCAAIRCFVGDGRTPFTHPVTLATASAPPLAGTLRELRYFADEGTVQRAPRGLGDRLGYAIVAGDRVEVGAALASLDEDAEVYRGD
ncbi:ATP-grasp domain-containing protein [Streptomyces sp. bgisy091]|uniref:ATP-grasp domain-containing protein n=1 Tax=Streptomyces sp. bgisy091 TaxID=3413778 RepID=UPI003D7602E0